MTKLQKLLWQVLSGSSDANVAFADLCGLLTRLGFAERIKGSHHIFSRDGVDELLNLQDKGGKAKPYQVKQVREVILKYRLAENDDE